MLISVETGQTAHKLSSGWYSCQLLFSYCLDKERVRKIRKLQNETHSIVYIMILETNPMVAKEDIKAACTEDTTHAST